MGLFTVWLAALVSSAALYAAVLLGQWGSAAVRRTRTRTGWTARVRTATAGSVAGSRRRSA